VVKPKPQIDIEFSEYNATPSGFHQSFIDIILQSYHPFGVYRGI